MRDIVECTLEVLEIKEKRSDSVRSRKWDGFNNFVEVTKRAMMKKRKPSSRKLPQLSLNHQQQPLPPKRTEMPTPPLRSFNRRRSLDMTSSGNNTSNIRSNTTSTNTSPEQEVFKFRGKAPRRRSTLMVDETMMNRTWAMSA